MGKPHIIYILSDQHHAGIAGFAGDRFVKTPALDALAAGGTVFRQCYCNSPLCVPSRASLLTGRLPHHTGVYNNTQALRSDDITMAHSLAVGGYHTVLSGRMHFVGYDQRHGFMERLVGDITPSFPGSNRQQQVYGCLKGTPDQSSIAIALSGPGDSAVLHYDDDVCQAACDYINEYDKEQPLFMVVGFYGPHCPFVAPPQWYQYYYDNLPEAEPLNAEERKKLHPAIRQWMALRGVESITGEELKRVRAAYYGMVTYLDGLVGKLVQMVSERFGREETMIVYGSDHGEGLGEHGLFWKSNFYEASVRVPLIFNWPGQIPAGRQISEPVGLTDLAPTLCDYGAAPELPEPDGRSLKPLVSGERREQIETAVVISELIDIKGDQPSAMICSGGYKLIYHCGYEQVQLFHLETDPLELLDLGQEDAYQEVKSRLCSQLLKDWNPEQACRIHAAAVRSAELMKQWVRLAKPAGIDEWDSSHAVNYVGREMKR